MKVQLDTAALIAQFAAKGGSVSVIPSGVRAIESDRTIYAAMREGKKAVADSVRESSNAEYRHHLWADTYHSARLSGQGVGDSTDYADSAVEGV